MQKLWAKLFIVSINILCMRLKNPLFKLKVRASKTSLERFRRTARSAPAIAKRAESIKGPALSRATKVANIVLERIPIDWGLCSGKKRLFRRNAASAILKKKPIGFLHCAERCNLALSLLNASGVKSWLAREMILVTDEAGKQKWHFHDYVEFFANDEVHTLVFHALKPVIDTYAIFDGPMEKIRGNKNSYIFRGADSQQIGGVASWREYEAFGRKMRQNPKNEVAKNERRMELLVAEGLIPSEAYNQIVFS